MFTGIIEAIGQVEAVFTEQGNKTFTLSSPLSQELKVDQSVSHNGVCLTVESIIPGSYSVTAIAETLKKTQLGALLPGDQVNLERCLPVSGRIDGHLVQGHVDTTGCVKKVTDCGGSWEICIEFHPKFAPLIIEKGSICVNGVSLTAYNLSNTEFSVSIIPFTWSHTNLHRLVPGQAVNLEFDLLGKYLWRWKELDATHLP